MRSISGMWSAVALGVGLGAGCTAAPTPDGSFSVTVTGTDTDCTTDTTGYRETFQYDLFFTGHVVDIDIENTAMATGGITGCSIDYTSPTWLEDRADGTYLQWNITGDAKFQTNTGLCLDDGNDWEGTETITVVASTDPTVAEGCTYNMDTVGVLVSN